MFVCPRGKLDLDVMLYINYYAGYIETFWYSRNLRKYYSLVNINYKNQVPFEISYLRGNVCNISNYKIQTILFHIHIYFTKNFKNEHWIGHDWLRFCKI